MPRSSPTRDPERGGLLPLRLPPREASQEVALGGWSVSSVSSHRRSTDHSSRPGAVRMPEVHYRSLYFSLDSPEDLELLGLLFALPRWRQPSAIKSALRQYLPTVLDGPPLGPDEVRTIVASTVRTRGRRHTHGPAERAEPGVDRARAGPHERDPRARRGDLARGKCARRRTAGRAPDREQARPAHEEPLDRLNDPAIGSARRYRGNSPSATLSWRKGRGGSGCGDA